jgi:hypothetical protein
VGALLSIGEEKAFSLWPGLDIFTAIKLLSPLDPNTCDRALPYLTLTIIGYFRGPYNSGGAKGALNNNRLGEGGNNLPTILPKQIIRGPYL